MNILFLLGNGGNAELVSLRYRTLKANVQMASCAGTGAESAENGIGGKGKENVAFFLK